MANDNSKDRPVVNPDDNREAAAPAAPPADDRDRQGQSGYGAGRTTEDEAMKRQQAPQPRGGATEEQTGVHTDDRWSGRGDLRKRTGYRAGNPNK